GLNVDVAARGREALLRDRGRWRDAVRQEFAPHLLIGRHGLDRRVVLVGAYEVGAVGAGRAQHRVDVLPDAKGLLFALGQAGVWGALRQHVRCDAVLEILRHDASGKHPATGLDALREFDFARPELDGKQRLCILVSHSTPSLQSSAASHCATGGYAGFLTLACVRHTIAASGTPRARSITGLNSAGATDESCAAMVELGWDISCRERHRLGPSGELSEPHHHRGSAVPGGRPDRRADAPCRFPAQDKIGQPVVIENRPGGSGTIGAAYVARATPDGYTLHANSLGDAQNLHYMPLPYHPVNDFAMIAWILNWPPLLLVISSILPINTT